jgi:acyl-coenzyme A thioesterase PaaI-like protein
MSTPEPPNWHLPDFTKSLPEPTSRQVELRRVGEAVRALISRIVATEAPESALAALAAELEAVGDRWSQHPVRTTHELAEASVGGDVHAFLDDSPMLGRANPIAPPLFLDVTDVDGRESVVGTVTFGPQYEGPPGHVHGGYVAAAFDEVLGMAQSLGGKPGMTGALNVRYLKPTPLRTPLLLAGWVERVEGRKIFCRGTVHVGDRLCAEADAIFVSVDFAKLLALFTDRAAGGSAGR